MWVVKEGIVSHLNLFSNRCSYAINTNICLWRNDTNP